MVEAPVEFIRPREPKPPWLKVRAPGSDNYLRLKGVMKELWVSIKDGTTKTYSATGLPPVVTINSTGTLTGNTPNIRTTYTVILTATDSVGATLTASIAWTLT